MHVLWGVAGLGGEFSIMGLGMETLRAFLNGHMGLTQAVRALAEARHACAEWGSGSRIEGSRCKPSSTAAWTSTRWPRETAACELPRRFMHGLWGG